MEPINVKKWCKTRISNQCQHFFYALIHNDISNSIQGVHSHGIYTKYHKTRLLFNLRFFSTKIKILSSFIREFLYPGDYEL